MDNFLNSKIGRIIEAKNKADEKGEKQVAPRVNFAKMFKWIAVTHSMVKGARKSPRVNKRPMKELRMPMIRGQSLDVALR